MESILSSASILMASISLIYSFYQKEINEALEYEAPKYFADAEPKYNEIKILTYAKLLPLILLTSVIILVYLPPVVQVITQAFCIWSSPDITCEYAPNLASLVIVEGFLVYLLVIFVGILRRLVKKLRSIEKKH